MGENLKMKQEQFDLKSLQLQGKRGNIGAKITGAILALIFLVILINLIPTMFGNSGLNNASLFTGTPTWLRSTLILVVAAGILLTVIGMYLKSR